MTDEKSPSQLALAKTLGHSTSLDDPQVLAKLSPKSSDINESEYVLDSSSFPPYFLKLRIFLSVIV